MKNILKEIKLNRIRQTSENKAIKLFNWFVVTALITLFGLVWVFAPSAAIANNIGRSGQVVSIIEKENQKLCQNQSPDVCARTSLLKEKYCKMSDSAFAFYRATNYLFWNDFSEDERLKEFGNEKTKTWLLGDLHVDNFGTFDNDKGEIVFDLNDFDESVVADYQYDLWRMAASIVLVTRELNSLATEPEKQAQIIDAFAESYLDTLASYRGNDGEVKTSFTLDSTDVNLSELLAKERVKNKPKKARKKMLEKWTNEEADRLANENKLAEKKLAKISPDRKREIREAMSEYGKTLSGQLDYKPGHFKVKDIAQRLGAGLGSLGTPRYYVLIEGESDEPSDDRILDVKRQSKPTAYNFLGQKWQGEYDRRFKNDAQRHGLAYRALIKDADDYLGWMELSDGVYSVRELSPFKDGILTDKLNSDQALTDMAKLWGKILATDHARADRDFEPDLIPYSFEKQVDKLTNGRHREFRALVSQVAFEYAEQVNKDYEAFQATLKPIGCL